MTLYHGTRSSTLTTHAGLCLTSDATAAAHYGAGQSFRVDVDLSGLTGRSFEVTRQDIDNGDYPADTDEQVAALVAAGVDYITYDDVTEQGREHDCIRLLSGAALARVDVASAVRVDRDGDEVTDEE